MAADGTGLTVEAGVAGAFEPSSSSVISILRVGAERRKNEEEEEGACECIGVKHMRH